MLILAQLQSIGAVMCLALTLNIWRKSDGRLIGALDTTNTELATNTYDTDGVMLVGIENNDLSLIRPARC